MRYGAGGALIDSGYTEITGKKPVNMSGGLISKGEPMGASHLGQIVEIAMQLRGTAGARQVKAPGPVLRTSSGQAGIAP